MGKYLDMLKRLDATADDEKNELYEKKPTNTNNDQARKNRSGELFRLSRLFRALSELEHRCPEYVAPRRWRQAVEDGKRFLAQWDEQAEALGWIARDLFGLHEVPANPHPTYHRLSRYDETGLIWLLQSCPVVALTEATAAIKMPTGSITTYRKRNKPAYGPLGDSTDDFLPR
jgi:hypothetical protein